jgi:hypothetical protein
VHNLPRIFLDSFIKSVMCVKLKITVRGEEKIDWGEDPFNEAAEQACSLQPEPIVYIILLSFVTCAQVRSLRGW